MCDNGHSFYGRRGLSLKTIRAADVVFRHFPKKKSAMPLRSNRRNMALISVNKKPLINKERF